MKTTVERVDDTTVKLSVTVESQRVAQAIDEAAGRLAQEVSVPGFRPGRAPRRILETRLGKDTLLQEAARGALPQLYAEAIQAEQLDVVGAPEFDVDTFVEGQEAVFSATVEVRPEIDLPDYTELQVPHPDWELDDEELQEHLNQLRERFATLETVKRGADTGDHVLVTVSATRDGEAVPEASGEDALYEVGDTDETGSEFDRQIVGAEAGAILKFTDTLGADFGDDLAGAAADFTVIVKEVKRKKLPELDDDFAQQASEFDTADELVDALREQLAQAKRAYARSELRGKVVEAVSDLVEVPLPQALVQEELHFRLHRLSAEAERHGMSADAYLQALGTTADDLYQRLEEDARKTVKAQLVVDAAGREQGIEVTRDDLGVEIARQAQRLGRDPKELAEHMTHPDRIGALVSDAFRRKTIDNLVAGVQVLGGPPDDEGGEPGDEGAALEAGAVEGHAAETVLADASESEGDGDDQADAGGEGDDEEHPPPA